MSTSEQFPLAGTVSTRTQRVGFLTSHDRVDADFESLLEYFRVSEAVRTEFYAALRADGVSLERGFSFQDVQDDDHLSIFVQSVLQLTDANKEPLKLSA